MFVRLWVVYRQRRCLLVVCLFSELFTDRFPAASRCVCVFFCRSPLNQLSDNLFPVESSAAFHWTGVQCLPVTHLQLDYVSAPHHNTPDVTECVTLWQLTAKIVLCIKYKYKIVLCIVKVLSILLLYFRVGYDSRPLQKIRINLMIHLKFKPPDVMFLFSPSDGNMDKLSVQVCETPEAS